MRKTEPNDDDYTGNRDERRAIPATRVRVPVGASSDRATDSLDGSSRNLIDPSSVSRLAATIDRVKDLRGRLADVASMRRRLEMERDRTTVQMAIGEHEMQTAADLGRDFCAARARHAVQSLHDESNETNALLAELDLVWRSLDRERQRLALQLGECERVVDALPTERERTRARHIIDEALSRLGLPSRSSQTFTRGDTKQYGQAR